MNGWNSSLRRKGYFFKNLQENEGFEENEVFEGMKMRWKGGRGDIYEERKLQTI